MDLPAALAALAAAGTEETRRVHLRHGAAEPLFGVAPAALRALAEQLGTDDALAVSLWATGNTDARCLAALVADPARIDLARADAWAADARFFALSDRVAELVARTPLAIDRMAAWIASPDPWVARAGWAIMGELARAQPEVPDAAFTPYLALIERGIHEAPDQAREAMNEALIAIGARSDELAGPALAAAARIGAVAVDRGDTPRTTADAASAIRKARRQDRPVRRTTRKRPPAKKPPAKKPPAKKPPAKKPPAKKPPAKKPPARTSAPAKRTARKGARRPGRR